MLNPNPTFIKADVPEIKDETVLQWYMKIMFRDFYDTMIETDTNKLALNLEKKQIDDAYNDGYNLGYNKKNEEILFLIKKYHYIINEHIELQKQTPLSNAAQHQLFDQNINLFNGMIIELEKLL